MSTRLEKKLGYVSFDQTKTKMVIMSAVSTHKAPEHQLHHEWQ
jgi:hypothetical protein